MLEYLPEIWIAAGFVLILLEFLIPGALIVFFGTSAIVVGLLMNVPGFPHGNGIPFLIFALLTVAQILVLRKKFRSWFQGDTEEGRESLEEYVGKTATVLDGFEENHLKGRVVFKGANWNAVSETTLKAGDEVEIVKREGITLSVKKL